jgi:hypothetical protein
MAYLINPPNKPGKSPDSSMLLPLKKRQIIVGSGGYNLIQDTLIKQGFENGLSLVYCQPALACPCPSVTSNEVEFVQFRYSSTVRNPNPGESAPCGKIITQMVLTWTFNQPIQTASFDSCFTETIEVSVSGPNAIYTIESNHPGSNVNSQPLYYELTVNDEYLFTGYFVIPACT